jgi:Caspase domain/SIR2-like domain
MACRSLLEKRSALIIAVSEYNNPLQRLSFCKNDGEEMYEVLKSLDYQIPDNNKLVGQVNGNQIKNTIYDFFDNESINSQDTILFYYSGHGIPDTDGDVYLASSEINPKQPYRNGFSFNELTKMMNKSLSTRVVAILDCCYSGAAKLGKGNEDAAATIGTAAIEKNSGSVHQGEGKCILSASQAAQEAYGKKKKDHSIFTFYLLEGLRPNEMAVDLNGNVTVDTLGKYVYDSIMSLPPDKRPNQKPVRKVEAGGTIVLASYPQFLEDIDYIQDIRDAEWDELLYSINAQDCTPFIGAGACSFKNEEGKPWLPSSYTISTEMRKKYEYPLKNKVELEKVSEYVAQQSGDMFPKNYVARLFEEISPPDFSKEEYKNTLHAVLADLNLPLYITTNFDGFMESALKSRGRKVDSEFCRWNKFLKRQATQSIFDKPDYKPSQDKPLVYHLYGDFNYPRSMVLTETDYFDFLNNLSNEEILPYQISTALNSTSLLLVGYRLTDINFSFISRTLMQLHDEGLGSALQLNGMAVMLPDRASGFSIDKKEQDEHTKNMFKNMSNGLRLYWGTANKFASELRIRWNTFKKG